jgi:hypothetical protein
VAVGNDRDNTPLLGKITARAGTARLHSANSPERLSSSSNDQNSGNSLSRRSPPPPASPQRLSISRRKGPKPWPLEGPFREIPDDPVTGDGAPVPSGHPDATQSWMASRAYVKLGTNEKSGSLAYWVKQPPQKQKSFLIESH